MTAPREDSGSSNPGEVMLEEVQHRFRMSEIPNLRLLMELLEERIPNAQDAQRS